VSTGLGHLWAGWRSTYIAQATATDGQEAGAGTCVLCEIIAPGHDDRERRVVWRGARAAAILNAYPYTSGHLMVLPTRHVGDLEDLEPDEAAELWDGVRRAVIALKGAYRPGGINLGANLGRAAGAGIPGHLHLHALPRWDGDTNFMTAVADVRVLPEPLDDTWAKLRAAWPA
jgi:diadenosine tetraphosphate (Ap4A) HIT family hydrolase